MPRAGRIPPTARTCKVDAADWSVSTATPNDYAADANALAGNDAAYQGLFDVFVSCETFPREDDPGQTCERYVLRFVAKGEGFDAADGAIAKGNSEARIPSGGLSTFKIGVRSAAAPEPDAEHEEAAAAYENIYTYVTSKMDGYRFLTDADIEGNPYQVGSQAYRESYRAPNNDYRLDASYNDGDYVKRGVVPADVLTDGCVGEDGVVKDHTVLGAVSNSLPGFQYDYHELDSSVGAGVEDYTFRGRLALQDVEMEPLSAETGGADGSSSDGDTPADAPSLLALLDGDGEQQYVEPFARNATGRADSAIDEGVFSTLKLRAAYPRLIASHAVQFDPATDRPGLEVEGALGASGSDAKAEGDPAAPGAEGAGDAAADSADGDEPAPAAEEPPATVVGVLDGAKEGSHIDRTGAVSKDDAPDEGEQETLSGEPLQYGDTPWYAVKIENKPLNAEDTRSRARSCTASCASW